MKSNENIINIALAFDNRYITPFYVLATSVIRHNPLAVKFHVIATIPAEEKKEITNFVFNQGAEIIFYDVDVSVYDKFLIRPDTHYSAAIFYRLLFPLLVQDTASRLLYLDVDTVVNGSLQPLFEVDLSGFIVCCVGDNLNEIRDDLGLLSTDQYFNSGVLLINIQRWLREGISERCIDYIQENGKRLIYPDQDALNVVLKGRWHQLDRRYNYMVSDRIAVDFLSSDQVLQPTIVHYNGPYKPWTVLCNHPFTSLYHEHLHNFLQSQAGIRRAVDSFEMFFPSIYKRVGDPQTGMFYAFVMHLLWIKALKISLNDAVFQQIFNDTYRSQQQLSGNALFALEQHANAIMTAKLEIEMYNRTQLIPDNSWTEKWLSDCTKRIQQIQNEANDPAKYALIPNLINDRFAITNILKTMVEYAVK